MEFLHRQTVKTPITDEGEHWIAVSDLMAGLMMVFLLVAVVFMVIVQRESAKTRDVAVLYERLRNELYRDLYAEFQHDLPRWGAELRRDLSLQFYNTELLFAHGNADLKPPFKAILDDFFPRYVKIITSDKYRDHIAEVRIEGHTSSGWGSAPNEDEAYIRNMALSQARTRSTLGYVLTLPAVRHEKAWLKQYLTANGLSSSKPVLNADGSENRERSRRVEFRLRTDADSSIAAILAGAQVSRPLVEAAEQ